MSDDDLLPCPFCGGEAHAGHRSAYSTDSSFDFIGCKDCGCMIEYDEPKWSASTQSFDDKSRAEAIAAWNRRYKPKAEELFDQQIAEYVKRGKP